MRAVGHRVRRRGADADGPPDRAHPGPPGRHPPGQRLPHAVLCRPRGRAGRGVGRPHAPCATGGGGRATGFVRAGGLEMGRVRTRRAHPTPCHVRCGSVVTHPPQPRLEGLAQGIAGRAWRRRLPHPPPPLPRTPALTRPQRHSQAPPPAPTASNPPPPPQTAFAVSCNRRVTALE